MGLNLKQITYRNYPICSQCHVDSEEDFRGGGGEKSCVWIQFMPVFAPFSNSIVLAPTVYYCKYILVLLIVHTDTINTY